MRVDGARQNGVLCQWVRRTALLGGGNIVIHGAR